MAEETRHRHCSDWMAKPSRRCRRCRLGGLYRTRNGPNAARARPYVRSFERRKHARHQCAPAKCRGSNDVVIVPTIVAVVQDSAFEKRVMLFYARFNLLKPQTGKEITMRFSLIAVVATAARSQHPAVFSLGMAVIVSAARPERLFPAVVSIAATITDTGAVIFAITGMVGGTTASARAGSGQLTTTDMNGFAATTNSRALQRCRNLLSA